MPTGKVKMYNKDRGYGFIERETGPDVFFHFTVLKKDEVETLKEGDNVEFEVTIGPKGEQAQDLHKI